MGTVFKSSLLLTFEEREASRRGLRRFDVRHKQAGSTLNNSNIDLIVTILVDGINWWMVHLQCQSRGR